jgi:hypothetical protein
VSVRCLQSATPTAASAVPTLISFVFSVLWKLQQPSLAQHGCARTAPHGCFQAATLPYYGDDQVSGVRHVCVYVTRPRPGMSWLLVTWQALCVCTVQWLSCCCCIISVCRCLYVWDSRSWGIVVSVARADTEPMGVFMRHQWTSAINSDHKLVGALRSYAVCVVMLYSPKHTWWFAAYY